MAKRTRKRKIEDGGITANDVDGISDDTYAKILKKHDKALRKQAASAGGKKTRTTRKKK